jgi:hypothetical protein
MILVVVDRFTEIAHFIVLTKKNAPTVTRAYLDNVWRYHGMRKGIVSERDMTFTSQYFLDVYIFLGIKNSMSTTYYLESDGQTERMNQVIVFRGEA